tara:strand:+ start:189 stop:416 length:228 start_codon:yes stop_codon:yes gene_type:complete
MNKHTPSDKQRRRRKKKEDKQTEQKTTKPFMQKDDAYMMKPYQAHHPMNMNHSAMKMKSPYNMRPSILNQMSHNK